MPNKHVSSVIHSSCRYVVGVDEVGRGPIAGPVAVGAVCWDTRDRVLVKRLKNLFPEVKDSKALSETKREKVFSAIKNLTKETSLAYSVAFVSARTIDTRGIVWAIRAALGRALGKVVVEPQKTRVLLDGGLTAPKKFSHQETCVRGDATHLPIALASIVAKVVRDRHMVRLDKQYPGYGFGVHKGYGTKAHYTALSSLGPSDIHRRSFLRTRS